MCRLLMLVYACCSGANVAIVAFGIGKAEIVQRGSRGAEPSWRTAGTAGAARKRHSEVDARLRIRLPAEGYKVGQYQGISEEPVRLRMATSAES